MKRLIIIFHFFYLTLAYPAEVKLNHGTPLRLIRPFHYQLTNNHPYYIRNDPVQFQEKERFAVNSTNKMNFLQENINDKNLFSNSNVTMSDTKHKSDLKSISATTKSVQNFPTSFSDFLFENQDKNEPNEDIKSNLDVRYEKISTEELNDKQINEESEKDSTELQQTIPNQHHLNKTPLFQPYFVNYFFPDQLHSMPFFYNNRPRYVHNPIYSSQILGQQEILNPLEGYPYIYNSQADNDYKLKEVIPQGLTQDSIVFIDSEKYDQNLNYPSEDISILTSTAKTLSYTT